MNHHRAGGPDSGFEVPDRPDDDLPELPGGTGALSVRLGITVLRARPDTVIGTMPVGPNTAVSGLLHGGASCVLAESLGSIGAHLHAMSHGGGYAVGVTISATHHRPVRAGTVAGMATALDLDGPLVSYGIVIVDDARERVCTARLICAVGFVRRVRSA